MRIFYISAVVLALATVVSAADKTDPRLAAARRAFVQAADDLSDDRPVAACVSDKLNRFTPLETVKTRGEADVILTVSDANARMHPKGHIAATLPDGTPLWDGGSKKRGFNLIGRDVTCAVAEDLVTNLRKVMRQKTGN